jgi:Ca2+-binding EF-hand superfamily protein
MKKKFKTLDEKATGFINISDFRNAMACCSMLTPKEVNVIMRSFKMGET